MGSGWRCLNGLERLRNESVGDNRSTEWAGGVMFLTETELADLTGYQLPAYQRRWLIGNSYPFEIDARGRPKVLRAYTETRMGGTVTAKREPKLRLS